MRSVLVASTCVLALLTGACATNTPTLESAEPGAETSSEDTAAGQQSAGAATPSTASGSATQTVTDPCTSGLTGDPSTTATATADFDGDGASDQITVYATGDTADPWRVRVDTAAGESFDSPLGGDAGTEANVRPIGGADLDGDGAADELFVVIGAGASTIIVGVYTRVGCQVVQVTLDGAPLGFPIGGSIGNIGGLACLDTDGNGINDVIVAWSGTADFDSGEGRYLIEGSEYRLRGAALERLGTRSFEADISEADFAYGQLSCETLNL